MLWEENLNKIKKNIAPKYQAIIVIKELLTNNRIVGLEESYILDSYAARVPVVELDGHKLVRVRVRRGHGHRTRVQTAVLLRPVRADASAGCQLRH